MKIRTDFVTNSSSSSFIVFFDKIPKSSDEVKELLFGDQTEIVLYDETYPVNEISENVFSSIKQDNPLADKLTVLREISSYISQIGYRLKNKDFYCLYNENEFFGNGQWIYNLIKSEEIPIEPEEEFKKIKGYDYWDCRKKLNKTQEHQDGELINKLRIDYDDKLLDISHKIYKRIKEKIGNKKAVYFEFSDNDGTINSACEHGDIFDKLPHFRVSHH